jgi:branched-chain amino acid transport system permease protein
VVGLSLEHAAAAAARLRRPAIPLLPEIVLAALGIGAFFAFPNDLAFLARILITGLFVLSLSLVLGQAGIPTLGHSASMGTGAYAAGLFAIHLSQDPLLGLLIGGLAGGAIAAVTGALLLRTAHLTFVMLTIAVAQILYEIANQAAWLTGGDNGLSGIGVDPILGVFEFDLYSRTSYLYALTVLVVSYFVLRTIVDSPFGLTSRGIHSDPDRMRALGCNTYRHLLIVFTIGGLFAGLSGALSAQVAQVVGLASLSFGTSGDALVMLIVGGSARLPGALVGTVVFLIVEHVAATVNPYHWLFIIGGLLIVTVLVLPGGLISVVDWVAARMPWSALGRGTRHG